MENSEKTNPAPVKVREGSSIMSLVFCLWWFTGIAVAHGWFWKTASLIPPVGMVIALERVIQVYAPALMGK